MESSSDAFAWLGRPRAGRTGRVRAVRISCSRRSLMHRTVLSAALLTQCLDTILGILLLCRSGDMPRQQ